MRAEVFFNDSQADAVLLFRGAPVKGGQVTVAVVPYDYGMAADLLRGFGLPSPAFSGTLPI